MAETPIGEVMLRNVRLSYGHIFRPQPDKMGDDGKIIKGAYQASFLMDPTTKDGKANLAKLKKAKEQSMKAKWGDKQPKLRPDKICTRNGDDYDGDEYQGMYFVASRNGKQPVVVDNRKDKAGKWIELTESDGRPYSGCYVNALVRVWSQDNEHGKRVNASLELVQYLKKGDAFGAAPADPNAAFNEDDVSDADTDEISDPDADDDGDGEGGEDGLI